MPDFRVEVDADTASALQTECELLGFEEPGTYLSWIVDNRAAIEQGTESARLLEAYRERLLALETRLDAEGVDPGSVDGNSLPDRSEPSDGPPEPDTRTDATNESAPEANPGGATAVDDGQGSDPGRGDPAADGTTPDASATTEDADATTPDADAAPPTEPVAEPTADHHGTRQPAAGESAAEEPTSDESSAGESNAGESGTGKSNAGESSAGESSAGEPTRDDVVREQPDSARAASDGGTSVEEADITSMHLRPERVQRVSEDPVTEDAGVLSDVATNRLDELSRRAVAETRRRLDRDVETGLDYDSSATLPGSTVRPGEDVADLDDIEVPGRSADLVERRRDVVGRALAYLRDEGRARRSDFVAAVYEDNPAGYETADAWWRCVRSGLDQVSVVDGGHVWEYDG